MTVQIVRSTVDRSVNSVTVAEFLSNRIIKSMRTVLVLLLAILCISPTVHAQLAGSGAVSGTVEDPTGAVIPNATVTATNVDTNVSTPRPTTRAGDFNITGLIPGTYTVTVQAPGFEIYKQENITVNALETVGLKIKMVVGAATDTVTITTAPPLLDTTDASLGATMDNEMYSNLPLQMGSGGNADQRRATDFAYLMPGVAQNYTNGNSTDATTGVNGSPSGVQEVYIEGVDLPEGDGNGDPRFTWTAIGVDAVNQFQVETAGISSQFAGQGVQNYAIKSGGNAIHGSLYEYFRNTMFDAWNFTNKVPTLNAQGVTVPGGIKPREVMNEFGIVLSGPIIKNKLFLFGNYGQYRFQHGATYAPYSIPTSLMLGLNPDGSQLGYADFTQYALTNASSSNCSSTASEGNPLNLCGDIYDFTTEAIGCKGTSSTVSPCTRTAFQGMKNGVMTYDVIPGSRLSQTAQYINKFWVPYEKLANQNVYTNNLNYGTPIGLANWYSTGRIDYNQSTKNQVSVIVAFGRQASTGPNSTSGLGPPFNASQSYHPVTTVDVFKDVYTITPHIVNQFSYGYGRYVSVSVTPNDAPQYNAASLGLLNTPPGQATSGYPGISGVGPTQGGYSWNSKSNNTFTATDNVQWEFGKHNFTFGGQMVWTEFNIVAALGGTGPMSYTFSGTQTAVFSSQTTNGGVNAGAGTAMTGGNSVASYMIGAASAGSVSNLFVPGLGSRWRDPSFWAQDDFKVTDKLTMNLGLRWDIFPAIKESHNIFSFFNPNGNNTVTGNKGTIEFAGNGDPSLYCNCNGSPSPIYYGNVGPRIGLAYSVNPKTVFRASYNVNFTRGNWTNGSQSGSPGTLGFTPAGSTPLQPNVGFPVFFWDGTACAGNTPTNDGVTCGFNGIVTNPTPPTGAANLAEYGTGNSSATGTTSGSSVKIFDPYKGARTPEYINWTVGIQRQITRDMSITISYVGSQGHFVSGGFDPLNRHNALPYSFAALAGVQPSGSSTIPCVAQTCTTPLLGTKWSATNQALVQQMGFSPQNPYGGGVTYTTANSTTGYFTAFPQYGVGDTTNFNGNTSYHALQLSLRQRPAHGLDFMLNYTYSKAIDDVGSFRVTDNPRLDRSLSGNNQPQNLALTVVYLSPFGKGSMAAENAVVRSLAKDWSLSGIFTYHSGLPVSFTGSGCGSSTILSTCMPSIVTGVNPRTQSYNKPTGGKTANSSASNYYAHIYHLNFGAFSVLDATNTAQNLLTNSQQVAVGMGLAAYQVGTAARAGADNVWGMGFYNIDLGLKRSFPVWEQFSLQFEADLLNATNHVVWPGPGGAVGSGTTPSATVTSPTATYGQLGAPTNQARDVQLSARLNW